MRKIMVLFETSLKVLSFYMLDESRKLLAILFEGVLEFLKFVFLLSLFNKKILLLKFYLFIEKFLRCLLGISIILCIPLILLSDHVIFIFI